MKSIGIIGNGGQSKKVQEILQSVNISDLIIKEFYRIKVGE